LARVTQLPAKIQATAKGKYIPEQCIANLHLASEFETGPGTQEHLGAESSGVRR
jgi:hypothetical protein